MNAIKPSWTRSPQPFAIKVKQSTAHKTAYRALSIIALVLLALSPLSTAVAASLSCLFVGLACAELYRIGATKLQVLCYSPTGTWSVYQGLHSFHGQLGKHSYRSRWLSIVAIEKPNLKTRYIIVFYDAVDSRNYSLLQMHLKFPA